MERHLRILFAATVRLLVCMGLFIAAQSHAAQFHAPQPPNQPPLIINSGHFILTDPPAMQISARHVRFAAAPANMTLQQIVESDTLDWQQPTTDSITFGLQDDPVWIRLRLSNQSSQTTRRLLEVAWATMKHIHFYQLPLHSGEPSWHEVSSYESGFDVDPQSHYLQGPHHVFPISVAPQSSSDIYFRIDSNFLIMAPMKLWPEPQYQTFNQRDLSIHALLLGMLLALLLYNFAIAIVTRDISYNYYVLYLASSIIYILSATGLGSYLIWGQWPWLRAMAYPLSIYTSMIFGSLFVRHFLHLRSVGGWYLWINNFSIGYWLISLVTVSTGLANRGFATDIFALSTVTLSLIYGIALWHRNHQGARMFTIAWMGLIISTIINILMIKGLIPYSATGGYLQVSGFVVEVILLAIALADRINWERSLRAKAQQRAYELQLAINQEREEKLKTKETLLEVEKQTNRRLEQMVTERTRELETLTNSLAKANRDLTRMSVTDALTGIMNRRHFDEQLGKEIRRCSRSGDFLTLLILDADHFKQVNDQHGHPVGDTCLRTMASRISACFNRPGDCVARYGGEEFAVILPNTKPETAAEMAEQLRAIMQENPIQTEAGDLLLTVSIGLCGGQPQQHSRAADLVHQADEALYSAKGNGRNQVVSYALTPSQPQD